MYVIVCRILGVRGVLNFGKFSIFKHIQHPYMLASKIVQGSELSDLCTKSLVIVILLKLKMNIINDENTNFTKIVNISNQWGLKGKEISKTPSPQAF